MADELLDDGDLRTEIRRLQVYNAELFTALRHVAVSHYNGRCSLCGCSWSRDALEQHNGGCLASPWE